MIWVASGSTRIEFAAGSPCPLAFAVKMDGLSGTTRNVRVEVKPSVKSSSNMPFATWFTPVAGQQVTAVCTSIERYTLESAGDDRNRILWTGPTGPGRKRLVLRVSYDEGQTFRKEHVIYGGLAAYSDISILNDKTVGVLWERGVSDGYQFITFTRIDKEFVDSGKM